MIPLKDYIDKEHGGNNSAFARSICVKRNQVQQWLGAKKPVYVVDGNLIQVLKTLKDQQ